MECIVNTTVTECIVNTTVILKECEIDKTVKILKYLQYGLYLQKIASLKNV